MAHQIPLAQQIAEKLVADTQGKEATEVSITWYVPSNVTLTRQLNRQVVGYLLVLLADQSCVVDVQNDRVKISKIIPNWPRRVNGDSLVSITE
jgi:hypothetical protein